MAAARAIRDQRYPDATVVFVAGSLIRGEGTPYSDIDLVVIYPQISCAYRESFRFDNFPVEAFVHDPETLNYFFLEVDRPSGVPALPQMVVEGIELPEASHTSRSLKELAASVIAMGPPILSTIDEQKLRYKVTDLIDDIRAPRTRDELTGVGAELFQELANYYLRTNGLWSASGKAIPRALKRASDALCSRYCLAFERLFQDSEPDRVISLAEELLRPSGGLLFEGHRLDAPPEWRKPLGK
jgi:hypothetical protein